MLCLRYMLVLWGLPLLLPIRVNKNLIPVYSSEYITHALNAEQDHEKQHSSDQPCEVEATVEDHQSSSHGDCGKALRQQDRDSSVCSVEVGLSTSVVASSSTHGTCSVLHNPGGIVLSDIHETTPKHVEQLELRVPFVMVLLCHSSD